MDVSSLLSAAEEFADSPDPIDSVIAVTICYLVMRSGELQARASDDLTRVGYIAASSWESGQSDGVRLLAMPVLDRVLIEASTGALDVDARDLEEINRARFRAGEPFWTT
jgi:hypothetical protein